MRNFKSILLVVVFALALTSCYTIEHTVGKGAQGSTVVAKKQWYAVFGLVPLNTVDSKAMAAGAEDYTIKTQHKFIDYVITTFTRFVTVSVKTVEVRK